MFYPREMFKAAENKQKKKKRYFTEYEDSIGLKVQCWYIPT